MTSNKSTAISSLITNTRTFIGKNRYTPVFIILIIILMGLVAVYYFKTEREKDRSIAYRFHRLEMLSEKWQRIMSGFEGRADRHFVDSVKGITKISKPLQFGKEIQTITIDRTNAATNKTKDTKPKADTLYRFTVFELPLAELITSLNWALAFDGFVLYKGSDSLSRDTIAYQTISYQENLRNTITSALTNGGLAELRIQSQDYQLFTYSMITRFGDQYTTWYLCGLVSKETLKNEAMQLDIWILLILITALLLIIMGFPLLKLIFVNEIERLNRKDIVLAGISVVLGAPIVIIMFLSAFYYADQYYFKIDQKLQQISADIERRMTAEFDGIVTQLNNLQDLNDSLTSYRTFKVLSVIDPASGILTRVRRVASNIKVDSGMNIRNRSYYEAMKSKQYWERNVLSNDSARKETVRYVVRPVLSLEENTEESVFVIHGRDSNYVAASVKPGSVSDPIVPPGYSFMVVDETGMVWSGTIRRREGVLWKICSGKLKTTIF